LLHVLDAELVIDALYVVTIFLLMMAYDWWSTGRVQSVTLWAGAFVVVAQQGQVSDWPHHALAEFCRVGSDSNTSFPLKPNSLARSSDSESLPTQVPHCA
jgi:hypothetical protein